MVFLPDISYASFKLTLYISDSLKILKIWGILMGWRPITSFQNKLKMEDSKIFKLYDTTICSKKFELKFPPSKFLFWHYLSQGRSLRITSSPVVIKLCNCWQRNGAGAQ